MDIVVCSFAKKYCLDQLEITTLIMKKFFSKSYILWTVTNVKSIIVAYLCTLPNLTLNVTASKFQKHFFISRLLALFQSNCQPLDPDIFVFEHQKCPAMPIQLIFVYIRKFRIFFYIPQQFDRKICLTLVCYLNEFNFRSFRFKFILESYSKFEIDKGHGID